MAKLPLYDKKDGNIIDYALIDDEHLEKVKKYTWICRIQNKKYKSVYAYINGKNIPLPRFLFGKPEQGNFRRKNKKIFDYTLSNIYQLKDVVTERLEEITDGISPDNILFPEKRKDTDYETIMIGQWKVLFDQEFSSYIKGRSWSISSQEKNGKFYCYVVRSSCTTTVSLTRVLLGIQDGETGENFPKMKDMVAIYKNKPTKHTKIIDLRLSNLMRVSRSIMSYHRRPFINKVNSPFIGIQEHKKKWRAFIKGKQKNKSIYLGSYKTAEEAAKKRDLFIIEHNLSHIISLNYSLERYKGVV